MVMPDEDALEPEDRLPLSDALTDALPLTDALLEPLKLTEAIPHGISTSETAQSKAKHAQEPLTLEPDDGSTDELDPDPDEDPDTEADEKLLLPAQTRSGSARIHTRTYEHEVNPSAAHPLVRTRHHRSPHM